MCSSLHPKWDHICFFFGICVMAAEALSHILSSSLILKGYSFWSVGFLWLIAKSFFDLMDFLLQRCFGEIVIPSVLGLDCNHFNQSLSWLKFLLGLKKKAKKKKAVSCLRFCLPLSFTKEGGGALEAPESPQLSYITGHERAADTDVSMWQ